MAEVIENYSLMATGSQQAGYRTAYITRTTGNQNFHKK